MSQSATEYEDEGTMTESGIVLRDPKKSSTTALTKFVTQTLTYYENNDEEGYDLWIYLKEDFYNWDEQSLNKVEKNVMRNLRNLLLNRNVYIPKDGKPIYKHIADLLVQPWQEWPAEMDPPKPKQVRLAIPGNITPVSDSVASVTSPLPQAQPQITLPLPTSLPASAIPPPINPETAPGALPPRLRLAIPGDSTPVSDGVTSPQPQIALPLPTSAIPPSIDPETALGAIPPRLRLAIPGDSTPVLDSVTSPQPHIALPLPTSTTPLPTNRKSSNWEPSNWEPSNWEPSNWEPSRRYKPGSLLPGVQVTSGQQRYRAENKRLGRKKDRFAAIFLIRLQRCLA